MIRGKIRLIDRDGWEKVEFTSFREVEFNNLFGEKYMELRPVYPTIAVPTTPGYIIEKKVFYLTDEKDRDGLYIYKEM